MSKTVRCKTGADPESLKGRGRGQKYDPEILKWNDTSQTFQIKSKIKKPFSKVRAPPPRHLP